MTDLVKRMEKEEALDFTSKKMTILRDESTESPILDLSCKKTNTSSCSLSPVSMEEVSSPASIDRPIAERISREETEVKSPFEGRSMMVTPPSEVDSPKKQKYDGAYVRQIEGVTTSMAPMEPVLGGYVVLPPVHAAAILSGVGSEQSVVEGPIGTQLPVSTTTPSTSSLDVVLYPTTSHQESTKKAPRPFKAYPKDPLTLSVGNAELLYNQTSTEGYSDFRKRMLESVRRTNEGTNVKMRRTSKSPGLPTSTMDEKDAAYWERRRKNNEAAKRSRDARRAKEDEIAIRAAFLEQENMRLKYEVISLRNETAKLRCMVYTT